MADQDILSGDMPSANPTALPEYTVSNLPSAKQRGMLIAVVDETGGYTVAFSDENGEWRRVQDRAIVS